MAETIKEIFQEYLRQDDGWQLMVKADVLRFLTFLTRSHTETAASSGIAPDEKAAAMRQLETVFLYVYRHYRRKSRFRKRPVLLICLRRIFPAVSGN
jgi:hypothetical protein